MLYQAIEEMKEDPMKGDVRPIKSGKFRGFMFEQDSIALFSLLIR